MSLAEDKRGVSGNALGSTSMLLAEGITAGYGEVPVIEGVSLRASSASVVGVIGPNGAGKSTFIKAIAGLIRPTAGCVKLAGEDVTGWRPFRIARKGIAYVPQVDNIFPSMSVHENLEMGGFVRKTGLESRIDEVLAIFPDLGLASRRKAGDLSAGQRNMLGMGRALMLDPKVLLLDEPTAGLGPSYVKTVWTQIRRIAQTGTAVVVVEQRVDLVLANADWVYVIVAGVNRLDGRASAVGVQHDLPSIFLGIDGVKKG